MRRIFFALLAFEWYVNNYFFFWLAFGIFEILHVCMKLLLIRYFRLVSCKEVVTLKRLTKLVRNFKKRFVIEVLNNSVVQNVF